MPYTTLQQQQAKVNTWCDTSLRGISQPPSGKMIILLPPCWRENFIFIEMVALQITPRFYQLPSPRISHNQGIPHTNASEQDIHFTEKKVNRSSKDNGIHCPASTPLPRTCWASRMFNGLLKTQGWCHLKVSWEAVLQDPSALKGKPIQGAVSPTARRKLRFGNYGMKVKTNVSHLYPITQWLIFLHLWRWLRGNT